MITLFLNCGMRLSELVGISLCDISDIERGINSLRKLFMEKPYEPGDSIVEQYFGFIISAIKKDYGKLLEGDAIEMISASTMICFISRMASTAGTSHSRRMAIRTVTAIPPKKPSQLFFGLTILNILCFPIAQPTKNAPTS